MKTIWKKISDQSLAIKVFIGAMITFAALYADPNVENFNQQRLSGVRPSIEFVPGEVLIQYKNHVNPSSAPYYTHRMTAGVVRDIQHMPHHRGPLHLAKLREGQSVQEAIADISSDPSVEFVQPNYIYHINVAPNDTSYGQLWGLKNTAQTITSPAYSTNNPGTSGLDMDAETAWNTITNCTSVVVAVIDSGVNYNHEDLSTNMATGTYTCPVGTGSVGCDFVGAGDADPIDPNGHGTHVAGTIGAIGNNSKGTTGVCWTAKILAVRVMGANGSGSTADIIEGLNWATATGAGNGNAKIVNMSLGGPGGSLGDAFDLALDTTVTNDVVVVISAGNSTYDHNTVSSYPCDYPDANIICVAAVDQAYSIASFSDRDTNGTAASRKVDIGAPGTNVLSTYLTVTTVSDSFSSGWTTSPSNYWSYQLCNFGGFHGYGTIAQMGNPGSAAGTTWCSMGSGSVGNSRTDKVYKDLNLSGMSGYDYVSLNFYVWYGLKDATDNLNVNYKSTGGDPFSSGTQIVSYSGLANTAQYYEYKTFDITSSGCMTSTCAIGFLMQTDATTNNSGDGASLSTLSVTGKQISNTAYGVLNGTSMASPHVAGIATMIRARNPLYTYTDVVNAILNGGDAATSMTSTTKSGKVADAFGALKQIPDISGVSLVTP